MKDVKKKKKNLFKQVHKKSVLKQSPCLTPIHNESSYNNEI